MNYIKAKELGFSSVMVDVELVIPVIKTEQIGSNEPIICLADKSLLEKTEEMDEIPLAFAEIRNNQIRLYEKDRLENSLSRIHGLKARKCDLTVII